MFIPGFRRRPHLSPNPVPKLAVRELGPIFVEVGNCG